MDCPNETNKKLNMNYNPNIHHRRSIRLKGYDYSQAGLYFITICCQDRICRFGKIENGEMILNEYGEIAHNEWMKTPELRPQIELDAFIVMPNHIHGIIIINETDRGELHSPDKPEIEMGELHSPESNSTNKIQGECNSPQRGFSDNKPEFNSSIKIQGESDSPIKIQGECNSPQRGFSDNKPEFNSSIKIQGEFNSPNKIQGECNSPQRGFIDNKTEFKSPRQTVGAIVRGYKSSVTKQLGLMGFDEKLWQRNYYEHIIRDEKAYHNISEYIINNPAKWAGDKFHNQ
jgi:putative transposase